MLNLNLRSKMTTELIIKGAILGIAWFFIARHIYNKGFWAGAKWAKNYIFNELKKRHENRL